MSGNVGIMMKMNAYVIIVGWCLIALSALGEQSDAVIVMPSIWQKGAVGLPASNAVSEVGAVLALLPSADTVLGVTIVGPDEIRVKVCGKDTMSGCERQYTKVAGKWVAGFISHWKSASQPHAAPLPPAPRTEPSEGAR